MNKKLYLGIFYLKKINQDIQLKFKKFKYLHLDDYVNIKTSHFRIHQIQTIIKCKRLH